MKHLFLLALIPLTAYSNPFITSDPAKDVNTGQNTDAVTHCGLLFDSEPKKDVPVAVLPIGKICKFDLAGITTGVHTIKATFVNIDPVWGRLESEVSAPFTFIKPSVLTVPSGLDVQP